MAFIKTIAEIEKAMSSRKESTKEFELGYKIVLKALESPLKQIAINAGKDDGSVIIEKVKNGKGNMGYDALKDVYVSDMFSAGIIDPMKVTRTALQNAVSAAAIFLTTDAVIADIPEEKKGAGGGMPSGMGDME